jgi:hypothetical protein
MAFFRAYRPATKHIELLFLKKKSLQRKIFISEVEKDLAFFIGTQVTKRKEPPNKIKAKSEISHLQYFMSRHKFIISSKKASKCRCRAFECLHF